MAKLNPNKLRQELDALREAILGQIERSATPLDPAQSEQRRAACRLDFALFLETYLPHYFPGAVYSEMHRGFFAHANRITAAEGKGAGTKRAMAAPRGNGKTSLVKALLVYCAVYGLRHYMLIISDALDQAVTILEAIKVELEANPRLALDFSDTTGEGRYWAMGSIVTRGGIKIQALGSGKRARGLSHGVHRPDLIAVDDLENDQNVATPEQRDKLEAWLNKTVLPLGPPDDTADHLLMGTVLHYDSVLARSLNSPVWESRTYRALIQMPDRMDIWEVFSGFYRSLGKDAALEFYERQKEAMDAGAEILWSVQSLVWLMLKRAANAAAFSSEYQNDPIDEGERIFSEIHYYNADERPPIQVTFGACDPSMGKSGSGTDPCALIILGRDALGMLYVLAAVISKLRPSAIIEEMIRLQRRWHCAAWAVETVQFQEFFATQAVIESAKVGVPLPVRGVKPTTDKLLRIATLQPHVNNGVIKFKRDQTILVEQLTRFPKAAHDDGPDALQMCFAIAYTRPGERVLAAPRRSAGGGRYADY